MSCYFFCFIVYKWNPIIGMYEHDVGGLIWAPPIKKKK